MRELLPDLISPRVWAIVALLALPLASAAQEVREVVSNRVSIGSAEATLLLEFDDGTTFEIAFLDGEVLVDGSAIGVFEREDELDTTWRALLGGITQMSGGALARALHDWTAPESLDGDRREVARDLDRILENVLERVGRVIPAVTRDSEDGDRGEGGPTVTISTSNLLRSLLRTQLIPALSEALEDIEMDGINFYFDEDIEIDSGLSGPILMVDGDLIISAEVDGDVVVVGGSLTLDQGARILGDVKLVHSRLYQDGGEVLGQVQDLDDNDLRSRIRDELRSELRNEIRATNRGEGDTFSPFASITHGVTSLFQDLITFVVLSAIGLGVVVLAKDNLVVVSETARRSPGRAGMVGLAGAFLVLPVWVLGSVALVVSIVGIIALPFWVVLFPLAVTLAAGLGYFGVACIIGEWLSAQRLSGLEWLDTSNTVYAVVAGIGTLVAFSVGAHVVGIVPGLGFFSGLFATIGSIALFCVMCVGFGAVLLTRGGRQPEFYDAEAPFDATEWDGTDTATPRNDDASKEPVTIVDVAAETDEDDVGATATSSAEEDDEESVDDAPQ